MCGRYVLPDEDDLGEVGATSTQCEGGRVLPRFNVAPTTQVPIVVRAQAGARELRVARWGLIPDWWEKEKLPILTFNARSEEAAEKPMWKKSFRAQRCLMPARGWFEWNENEPIQGVS